MFFSWMGEDTTAASTAQICAGTAVVLSIFLCAPCVGAFKN
jgi:hypothetical protein